MGRTVSNISSVRVLRAGFRIKHHSDQCCAGAHCLDSGTEPGAYQRLCVRDMAQPAAACSSINRGRNPCCHDFRVARRECPPVREPDMPAPCTGYPNAAHACAMAAATSVRNHRYTRNTKRTCASCHSADFECQRLVRTAGGTKMSSHCDQHRSQTPAPVMVLSTDDIAAEQGPWRHMLNFGSKPGISLPLPSRVTEPPPAQRGAMKTGQRQRTGCRLHSTVLLLQRHAGNCRSDNRHRI